MKRAERRAARRRGESFHTLFAAVLTLPLLGAADAAAQEADSLAGRPVALAEPWGEHAVGVITAVVLDSTRTVVAERGAEISRPLLVRLWYPASDAPAGAATKPYMHPEVAEAWRGTLPVPSGWEDAVTTNAVEGAAPAESEAPWPVILFSHGLSWPVENYQLLLEDLASRGWVVVAISHPGEEVLTRLPDGTRIPFAGAEWDDEDERAVVLTVKVDAMVRDAGLVLDWLRGGAGDGGASTLSGRLDLERGVGYAGHSLGGAAAAWALRRDARVAAAASWEGQVYRAEDRPLVVAGPLMYLVGGANRAELAGRHFRGGPEGPVYEVVLRGTWHASPSDLLYIYERYAPRDWRERHRREISAARANQITADYLHAFFSRHLLGVGDESDLLEADGPDEAFAEWSYPEVEMRRSVGDGGFWTAESRH